MSKQALPGSANRFRRFFLREGVKFSVAEGTYPPFRNQEVPTALTINCGQTIFHFDKDGEYLGLEWDEMGCWDERIKKND